MAGKSLEDFLQELYHLEKTATSKDLKKAIRKLEEMHQEAAYREREEKRRVERIKELERRKEEKRKEDEHIKNVTSMDLPMDWDNIFDSSPKTAGVHAESISDGLILSLSNLGRVDIEYIAAITGEKYKTVIETLKGSIYQNPKTWNECFYKGWETAEEYLSGNLHDKFVAAVESNKKYKGYFEENVEAIRRVFPEPIDSKDIYITLGSPWVPTWVIDSFIDYIMRLGRTYQLTLHNEQLGVWEIVDKGSFVTGFYGIYNISTLHLLEKTLNMKPAIVYKTINCTTNSSGKKRVVDEQATIEAQEKQQKLIKDFKEWVWKDNNRKNRLEEIYNQRYGSSIKRNFDGTFLTFPNMSPNINLYQYQKNAVARMIFTTNTLLAHDVGSGKTYAMIAAGMEMLRMGISQKNMYVVPNNIVGQWRDIFAGMYPNATLLVVEPKSFKPNVRKQIMEDIRDNDYDGIIIAYSCFEHIKLSVNYRINRLKAKQTKLEANMKKNPTYPRKVQREIKKLKKEIGKLTVAQQAPYNGVYFEDMGVTRLFVDEAHNFKNVPFETKIENVMGLNSTGSKKCEEMYHKVQCVQKDGGVILATGTPITNSITDAYIMQKYLQSGELGLLDLQHFDGWVGMFAEQSTEFEIDVDTGSYRLATRFSKFHNLPELTTLLASIADFHHIDSVADIPEHDGYQDALISKTKYLEDYLKKISERAENVRAGAVPRTEDNMLKITTDGRKAALDIRLVDPNVWVGYQSKVARCVENVAEIYFKTLVSRSTQVIFCDYSTPKKEFNMYDDIKQRLVLLGVNADEIAFAHSATTEKKRKKLFDDVRKGNIRIILGSTFKIGMGVNIQDKLLALHHIDVPWRPADMVQREGRILRQGNTNKKVTIFRYITEGSFDAYSWQLLETKQRFISELLSGTIVERSGSDIEDTVLDYAEVKALAVGNPLVKDRVEAYNELTRYRILQKKYVESRIAWEKEKMELPSKIKHHEDNIKKCIKDIDFIKDYKKKYPEPKTNAEKKKLAEERKLIRVTIHEAIKEHVLETKEKYFMKYRGFDIILPANMKFEKPFIWLEKSGRYYVELGNTEVGNLIRIDNYLDNLNTHLEELKESVVRLEMKLTEVEIKLSKDENFHEQIDYYRELVDQLDEKLGVK